MVTVGETLTDPEVPVATNPIPVQEVTSAEIHVSVALWPGVIDAGAEENETIGWAVGGGVGKGAGGGVGSRDTERDRNQEGNIIGVVPSPPTGTMGPPIESDGIGVSLQ